VRGDFTREAKGKTAYDAMYAAVYTLGEVNNKAINNAMAKSGIAQSIWNGLQKYDTAAAEFLETFWKNNMQSYGMGKPPLEKMARSIWMAKATYKIVTNKDYRKAMEMIMSGFGLDPRGDIQTILRDFFEGDELTNAVDMLALKADRIDTAKNIVVNTVVKSLHKGFKKTLSKEQEEAITTAVLDTDLSVLNKLGRKEMSKLMRSDEHLATRISRVKHRLRNADATHGDWNVNQAVGLGYYMVTGKTGLAQNLNAINIGRGINSTVGMRKPSYKAVALIDELATLIALQNTNKDAKKIVGELFTKEGTGIQNVLNTHEAFKKESAKTVFESSKTNMIKGYTREIFDGQVTMEVGKVSDEAIMKDNGFKKMYDIDSKGINGSEKMAIYVADSFETAEIYRTATRLTAIKSKGTSVKTGIYRNEDVSDGVRKVLLKKVMDDYSDKAADTAFAMENGTWKHAETQGNVMPVLDEAGFVIDYRFVMPKTTKKELLGQQTMMSEVLGKSFSSIVDKTQSYEQNQDVLDYIVDDMKENYQEESKYGKNLKEYIILSKDSTDPEVQDLYSRLPKIFKDQMKKGPLAVRADLFHSYFGYRHLSITDNKYVKMLTPAVMRKAMRVFEKMWMEMIKITKVDLLVKMPVVIMGNLVSNFMYGVMTSTDPITLMKMYLDTTRDVNNYFKAVNKLEELKLAKASGNVSKKDLSEIPVLEKQIKESDIHELAETGIYQSIVEDVDTRELESTNKLIKKLDANTEFLPQAVKGVLNTLYLTRETKYYKAMNEVLTKSDLIARAIENKKLKVAQNKQASGEIPLPMWYVMRNVDKIEGVKYKKTTKKLVGKEKEEFMRMADTRRHTTVLNAFVNYNKPSGAKEEYLNRIGLIMFTKYAKRIQKVIGGTAAKHPLNVLAVLLGEELVGVDVDTIYDQSVLDKSWYNLGLGQGDYIPGMDLFDHVLTVVNPPLIELITHPKVF